MARQAAVAAGDWQTVQAAAAVLRSGGNAVDAAIAAGCAAAVAEPTLTSLGGGGFLLTRTPDGATELLDFFVDAPGRGLAAGDLSPHFTPVTLQFSDAEQTFHVGYGSVAVPGVLAGYLTAHRAHGVLPLRDVVAPAASLARRGAHLGRTQTEVMEVLAAILTLTPEAASLFTTVDGVFRNPEYADFLEDLAAREPAGWADVPQLADAVAAMRDHHGLLTADDLEHYRVMPREPQTVEFANGRLTTNPPPSFGGSIVCRALADLDGDRSPGARRIVEALHHATESQKTSAAPSSTKGTTHVSVIDGDGLVASMTTSNGSCSGVLVPGTGVQLNNMMGESDLHPSGFHGAEPGTRVASMMAPSLLDLADGSVVAIGSGGSERIRSALLQVIAHLGAGRSLDEAVSAPRVHFDGQMVQVEPEVPLELDADLATIAPVNRWSRSGFYFGGVSAVRRHPDGRLEAAGDARRDGAGMVVDLPG